jgi:hypothetical protein
MFWLLIATWNYIPWKQQDPYLFYSNTIAQDLEK